MVGVSEPVLEQGDPVRRRRHRGAPNTAIQLTFKACGLCDGGGLPFLGG